MGLSAESKMAKIIAIITDPERHTGYSSACQTTKSSGAFFNWPFINVPNVKANRSCIMNEPTKQSKRSLKKDKSAGKCDFLEFLEPFS